MKENIKLFTKIAFKSFVKWLLLVFSGTIVSTIFLVIILFQNSSLFGGGHGNAAAFVFGLLVNNIFAFVLVAGFPVFIFLYFMIANKHAFQQAIKQIYNNKIDTILENRIESIVDKTLNKNSFSHNMSNENILRSKLIEVNKADEDTSKMKKKIVNYLFKKINLSDVDFNDKDLKLSKLISRRIEYFVAEKIKPSLFFFWIMLLLQITIFIFAQFYS